MAAADAPATLSELRTAFLDHLKEVTGVAAVNTVVDRHLNIALQDMHQERWPWAERRNTIRTNPAYTTGTVDVAVTNLTTRRTVTGTGTLWNTNNSFTDINGIGANAKMTLGTASVVHLISTVDSDTGITLSTQTPFTGATALDDAGYAIFQDEYALASDYSLPIDVRYFDEARSIELIGAQEFYRLYARNSTRGQPKVASLIELGPGTTVALRPRVVFGPAPDTTYIIPYRYTTTNLAVSSAGVGAANLAAAADEPIVPIVFRMAIVWKALEIWFSSRQKNAALAGDFASRYTTLMLRARQRVTPGDDRPRFVPRVAPYWNMTRKPWRAAGGKRFDGGIAWDEIRYAGRRREYSWLV